MKEKIMIKGKNIVITGANSGIGLETLKLLAQGDNKILAVDLRIDRIEALALKNVSDDLRRVDKRKRRFHLCGGNRKTRFYRHLFRERRISVLRDDGLRQLESRGRHLQSQCLFPHLHLSKYVEYLGGKQGQMAITVSAIGKLAMPGYTLYSASKFAMQGFQQGLRYELPKNVSLTCLYPIATDTGFFKKQWKGRKAKSSASVRSPCKSRNTLQNVWSGAWSISANSSIRPNSSRLHNSCLQSARRSSGCI